MGSSRHSVNSWAEPLSCHINNSGVQVTRTDVGTSVVMRDTRSVKPPLKGQSQVDTSTHPEPLATTETCLTPQRICSWLINNSTNQNKCPFGDSVTSRSICLCLPFKEEDDEGPKGEEEEDEETK
ncbi:unnamed protein product [Leuciscus chuanchicus]